MSHCFTSLPLSMGTASLLGICQHVTCTLYCISILHKEGRLSIVTYVSTPVWRGTPKC